VWAHYPTDVACRILLAVPIDNRLACRAVCASWRAWLLCEPRVWADVDLMRLGTRRLRANDALLASAVAAALAAGGAIRRLAAVDCPQVTPAALLAAARASGGAMAVLVAPNTADAAQWTHVQLSALFAAAPALARVAVDVRVDSWAHARALLRGAPPFAPLRVRNLHVSPAEERAEWTTAALGDVAAAAVAHGCASLHFFAVRTLGEGEGEALEAVCDAVAGAACRRTRRLHFVLCALGPAAWAPLARVLSAGALTHLAVVGDRLLGATSAQALPFCDALRASSASSSLLSLTLDAAAPHDAPAGEGAVDVIAAAAGHASLRELRLSSSPRLAALGERLGGALAALVRAPGGALALLDVSHCSLGDAHVAPLLAALAGGAQEEGGAQQAAARGCALATLNLAGSALSRELEAGPLLAAAAGAPSLRRLDVEDMHSAAASAAARRARMLVERRCSPLAAAAHAAAARLSLLTPCRAWDDTAAWDTPTGGGV
jgi:hypothetical protein